MGSTLSPIVANLFFVYFETKALESAIHKLEVWLRYVDDTFVIWTQGREKLDEFLEYLNKQHDKIKFTMEIEKGNKLVFLDVLVTRKPDGTLGHTVYRKVTHTNRYLHTNSHHRPAQIHSVAKSLIFRSKKLSDANNIRTETKNVHNALLQNGFR